MCCWMLPIFVLEGGQHSRADVALGLERTANRIEQALSSEEELILCVRKGIYGRSAVHGRSDQAGIRLRQGGGTGGITNLLRLLYNLVPGYNLVLRHLDGCNLIINRFQRLLESL